jgi:hypothetical protein
VGDRSDPPKRLNSGLGRFQTKVVFRSFRSDLTVYFPAVAPPDAFAGMLNVNVTRGRIAALDATVVAAVRKFLLDDGRASRVSEPVAENDDDDDDDGGCVEKPWTRAMPAMAASRRERLLSLFMKPLWCSRRQEVDSGQRFFIYVVVQHELCHH